MNSDKDYLTGFHDQHLNLYFVFPFAGLDRLVFIDLTNFPFFLSFILFHMTKWEILFIDMYLFLLLRTHLLQVQIFVHKS